MVWKVVPIQLNLFICTCIHLAASGHAFREEKHHHPAAKLNHSHHLFVQFLSPLLKLILARRRGKVVRLNRALYNRQSLVHQPTSRIDVCHTGLALCALAATLPPDVAWLSSLWSSCVEAFESDDSLATLSVMPMYTILHQP